MFKNYLKTTLRNLWKNKVTSFINLFGLTIGMTTAVYIFLWVQNEMSFNDYHPDREHIYRITNAIQVDKNENWKWETSPMNLTDMALKEIPEIQKLARVSLNSWVTPVFNVNNKMFAEQSSAYVEKTWFNLFHYDFIEGSAAAFGSNPFSLILTASKARKYFGDASAIGQIIKIDTVAYTVQGVVKDNPLNSSFKFDLFLQMDARLANPANLRDDKSWGNFTYISFIQLRPDAGDGSVAAKLNGIMDRNRKNNNDKVSLVPLNDIYFESDLQSSEMPHGNRKTTYIFSLLGLLLLVTACINYVNLTTAKASLRAREVSVRKIVGAYRGHLFLQFITESLCISVLALLLSLVTIKLCLPLFNAVTEKQFVLPLTSLTIWKVLLGTLLFATIFNGVYPAALLSSFKPLNVFRGKSVLKMQDGAVRKGLVVFQFTLSVILITGTIVIYRQLNYIQKSNPGYNVSQVFSLRLPFKVGMMEDKAAKTFISSFRQELETQSSIAAVSTGGAEIVDVHSSSSGNADWDGHDSTFNPTIARLSVDAGFQKMFRLQLKQGRWFAAGLTDQHNYILNETAVAMLNIHQPTVGQRFTWGGDTGQVIGVVKDFHFKSMHEKIGPMVLFSNDGSDNYIFVKTVAGNTTKALSAAEAVWAKFIPDEPINYHFLDDSFNALYKTDIKTSRLILVFSVIAIIICALGLFGLAAFTAEQRTKEIGIRKVLGASVQQITALLSKEFVALVAVAILIASPLAWWIMNKWLQEFAYRVNIGVWIFIAAGALALFIALLSVSTQAIRAAVANPVKSLRSE